MKSLQFIEKFMRVANRASMAVACLFLCVLTVLVAIAVLCRYVFNEPLAFAEEISQYMMLGIVFLGLGYVMHNDRHIRVELIYDVAPAGMRSVLSVIIEVATLAYAVLMTAASITLFWSYYSRGSKAFTILETPLMYPALLLIIGSSLLTLEVASQVLRRCLSVVANVDAESEDRKRSRANTSNTEGQAL